MRKREKEKRMIFKIIIVLVILTIGFVVLSLAVYNNDVKKKMKNRTKPERIIIDSKTIDGKEVTNELFRDKKMTMINIWGTYCPSCIKELPYLQEIYDEFKEDNLGMVGVIIDVPIEKTEGKEFYKAKKILDEHNIQYPNVQLDQKFKECTTGKIFFVPTTIFVDHEGKVIGDLIESAYSKNEYVQIINQMLRGNDQNRIDDPSIVGQRCTLDGKCESEDN